MLFSKVGLDHFNKVLSETLNLFQALLQLTPPKLSPTHLLQIMAINMFAVDNTQIRGKFIYSFMFSFFIGYFMLSYTSIIGIKSHHALNAIFIFF